jgi:hypothetical protein
MLAYRAVNGDGARQGFGSTGTSSNSTLNSDELSVLAGRDNNDETTAPCLHAGGKAVAGLLGGKTMAMARAPQPQQPPPPQRDCGSGLVFRMLMPVEGPEVPATLRAWVLEQRRTARGVACVSMTVRVCGFQCPSGHHTEHRHRQRRLPDHPRYRPGQ